MGDRIFNYSNAIFQERLQNLSMRLFDPDVIPLVPMFFRMTCIEAVLQVRLRRACKSSQRSLIIPPRAQCESPLFSDDEATCIKEFRKLESECCRKLSD